MSLKRLLGSFMGVCAIAVLVGSVGAGAAHTPARHAIDLSTNSAVKNYLRSLGVSPRGVVIQRGAKNYAGPRCPGKGWTCTRSHRVVQVATGHGRNTFRCALARCLVVQASKSLLAAPNVAKCVRITGITQSCSITQTSTSAENQAIVAEVANKSSGLTQNASQTAQITQTSNSGLNRACVLQTTNIDASTISTTGRPVTVTLDAHQVTSITQNSHSGGNATQNATSSGGGGCASGPLNQSQTLTSTAKSPAGITQNQNTAGSRPNMLLNIQQNQADSFHGSASGTSSADWTQTNTLTAFATSTNGTVTQVQSTENGGLEADVNQFSFTPSDINSHQTEMQCERAVTSGPLSCATPQPTLPAGWSQTQHGPMRKDPGSTQEGSDGHTFTVVQDSTQTAAGTGNVTQSNVVQGACATSGNCTVDQTTTVQGVTTHNVQSGQNIDTTTTCSGADCTPTCTGSGCTTFTEEGNQVTATNVDLAEFGDGGMRGIGTGSIAVSGVTGGVSKAFLYWNGPTNSADPDVNADVTFNGSPITGTNIGISGDNNWGFLNSQSYRADVTSLVTGNGTYSLANFVKADADINGVALFVFYDNGNGGDDRNVVLWNGDDSNCLAGGVPENWDETITGVPYQGGSATLDFVVADGQSFADDAVLVNDSTLVPAGQIFDGNTGGVTDSLWDVESFDLTSFLTTGSNNLHITTGALEDCLSLVVAAANVPASAPVILAPTTAAVTAQKQSASAPTRQQTSGVTGASSLGGVSR